MKIASARLYRYELPLTRPLPTAEGDQSTRAGLVVELQCDMGKVAFGEISPLPGYSRETLDEAAAEARAVLHRVVGSDVPDHLEELSGGFRDWLGDISRLPSVRFGFESAVLQLLADHVGLTLERLLTNEPSQSIPVNGLLTGEPGEILERATTLVAEGYRTLKLKVGRLPIDSEIGLIAQLRRAVGPEVHLRLDANRRLAYSDAVRFLRGVEVFDIEYVEEPVDSLDAFKALLGSERPRVPLALDESLRDLDPGLLSDLAGVRAVVLKPTVLGLERAMMFACVALARGMRAVVTSTFETGVGLTVLARLAATLPDRNVPMGLDTLGWLGEDLLTTPVKISDGCIELPDLPDVERTLRRELLVEVTDG